MFPVDFDRPTMLTFLLFFVFSNCITLIENRLCPGVRGLECCFGFALNNKTGLCEKCSIGYYGKHCDKKCNPPTYGEDCQYICQCPQNKCNFKTGCSERMEAITDYLQESTTRIHAENFTSTTSIGMISLKAVFYSPVTLETSTSSKKITYMYTAVYHYPQNIGLLKNTVFIGLFGVFILIFSVFVFAYIYFKCFKKNSNFYKMKEKELQGQYESSLRFDVVDPQMATFHEPQGQDNGDSVYISPVFSRSERLEIYGTEGNNTEPENDAISREITVGRQRLSHDPSLIEAVLNRSQSDEMNHVYIEITDGRMES